jgi:hypothetical protein
MKKQVDDPGGPGSQAARTNKKTVPSPEEKEEKKNRKGEALRRRRQERRLYNEMVVKTFLLGHIKDPYEQNLRDAIRNRVDSDSRSIIEASPGLMHLAREVYRDVTHMETVEIPDELFDQTFIRHLMLGTGEARRGNERVQVLHENFAEFRSEGNRYRGDGDIYIRGAMKYLTNLKNHLTVNLERFMIRTEFALYPGISRKGISAMINGITNDRQREDEIEFVDKKPSHRSMNEVSVIRAAIQEHRAVLGLANPAKKGIRVEK